jgi:CDP-diacylglycerol--serine O-phosphatidyltransferase
MIADMLDGRVARMSHTTSSFGGQLDSLCDMVSFGIAPAFRVLKFLQYKYGGLVDLPVFFDGIAGRFVALAAGVYLACAAIRLARFNVENEEDETAHMTFIGLPTPAAAGAIASLVIFCEDMLPNFGVESLMYTIGHGVIIYSLPFVALGTAILMTSRIAYPHLVNKVVKGKKPITYLFWVLATIGLIWLIKIPTALVFSFCAFALSGCVRWLYTYRSRNAQEQEQEPVTEQEE